jgi:hypothetical protein
MTTTAFFGADNLSDAECLTEISITMAKANRRPNPGLTAKPMPMLKPSINSSALVPPASTGAMPLMEASHLRVLLGLFAHKYAAVNEQIESVAAPKPTTNPPTARSNELNSNALGSILKVTVPSNTPLAKPTATDINREV